MAAPYRLALDSAAALVQHRPQLAQRERRPTVWPASVAPRRCAQCQASKMTFGHQELKIWQKRRLAEAFQKGKRQLKVHSTSAQPVHTSMARLCLEARYVHQRVCCLTGRAHTRLSEPVLHLRDSNVSKHTAQCPEARCVACVLCVFLASAWQLLPCRSSG
jgi:hypothetical protein